MREDHDLTQKQVAQLLGMSQTGYSKYETGENDIPTAVLIKLADFYKTTTDYLLGRTDKNDAYPKVRYKHPHPKNDRFRPVVYGQVK